MNLYLINLFIFYSSAGKTIDKDNIKNSAFYQKFEKLIEGDGICLLRKFFYKTFKKNSFLQTNVDLIINTIKKTHEILNMDDLDIMKKLFMNTEDKLCIRNGFSLKSVLIATFISRFVEQCNTELKNYDNKIENLDRKLCQTESTEKIFTLLDDGINKKYKLLLTKIKLFTRKEKKFYKSVIENKVLLKEIITIVCILKHGIKDNNRREELLKCQLCSNFNDGMFKSANQYKLPAFYYLNCYFKNKKTAYVSLDPKSDEDEIKRVNSQIGTYNKELKGTTCGFSHVEKNLFKSKILRLSYENADLLLGLLVYHTEVNKKRMLLYIKRIDENEVEITFLLTEEEDYVNPSVDYEIFYEPDNEKMDIMIKLAIKTGKLCGFTNVTDLFEYTFEEIDGKGFYGTCHQLKCGHFIGMELKKEYFNELNRSCHLCRIKSDILHTFTRKVYLKDEGFILEENTNKSI